MENNNDNKKICTCGGEMTECFFSQNILPMKPQITIDNGFYNNSVSPVDTFVCKKCGRIEFFAQTEFIK